MADEKYHIEDFDDVDIVISKGSKSAKKDEADKLVKAQPKIIYESSDDYSVYDEDVYDDYYKNIYDDIYEEAKSKNLSRKNPKRYMLKKKIHLKDRIVSGTGW